MVPKLTEIQKRNIENCIHTLMVDVQCQGVDCDYCRYYDNVLCLIVKADILLKKIIRVGTA